MAQAARIVTQLSQLDDVNTGTPSDNDALTFDTATGKWVAEAVSASSSIFYDVTAAAYGATGDGVTDDGPAIQLAVDAAEAAGGGIVFFPETTASYKIATGVVIDGQKRLELYFAPGAKVTVAASTVAFQVHTSQGPRAVAFTNPHIDGLSNANSVGIEVWNTDHCTIRNAYITACGIGIWLHATGAVQTGWVERCSIQDTFITDCLSAGIKFTPHSTTNDSSSFMETDLSNVGINTNDAASYGILVEDGCQLYRTSFRNVVIWVWENATGLYLDGDAIGSWWEIFFEVFPGHNTNTTALQVGANAINVDGLHLRTDFLGPFTNEIVDTSNKLSYVYRGHDAYIGSAANHPRIFQRGDTYARLKWLTTFAGGGGISFGPGNADVDVTLYRKAANVLATDDVFVLGVYTEATKPAAAAGNAGAIIYVSDGAAGQKFQASNGSAWVYLDATGGGALADHDHSGDTGDGGTFDAANLTSGSATDGYVLTADGSGGAAWEAVPTGTPAPSTLEYITASASEDLANEIVIPGLAGSPDRLPASPNAYDDEFDSSTLDAKWNITSTAGSYDVDTTWPSRLYINFTGNQSFKLKQTVSAAGAFSATVKVHFAPQGNNQGIYLESYDNDESECCRCAFIYKTAENRIWMLVDKRVGGSWSFQAASQLAAVFGGTFYIHVQRDGSNNWLYAISSDGFSWQRVTIASVTLTLDHVDVDFEQGGITTPLRCGVDWFRWNWLTL